MIQKIEAIFRLAKRKITNWRLHNFVEQVRHGDVIQHVREEGRTSGRYNFMVLMSCGIAMLGLLLSSPAVVIGAMLISPLMGPIMSLGFSLCVLDFRQLRRALIGIVIGLALSLGVSYIIVSFSPLTDVTPEILARTQPNLFDLLVAIFSGLAGGYAVTMRKGETIVGVAIATALMPPLAVTGFGIATGSMPIAQGAFFLFMTNLLAISLTVTAVAKWYGFGRAQGRNTVLWQSLLTIAVFAALSLPLGTSLKNIAHEAYATKVVRSAIQERFSGSASRMNSYTASFPKGEPVRVDAVMLTKEYQHNAEEDIIANLGDKVKEGVTLTLDQIVVKRPEQVEEPAVEVTQSSLSSPMTAKVNSLSKREEMLNTVHNAVFFPTRLVEADVEKHEISIYARQSDEVNLGILRGFELEMERKFPAWKTFVIPAPQSLPYVYFDVGARELSEDKMKVLDTVVWALKRWEINQAEVVGFASTIGEYSRFNNRSLAYVRAKHVADKMTEAGLQAKPRGEYLSRAQKREEREYGTNSFHRVEVRLGRKVQFNNPLPKMDADTAAEQ